MPQSTKPVYAWSFGKFLPGPAIPNDEMESYLGLIGGKPSRARERVLKQNGIRSRYYAMDKEQKALYRNSEMAALAVKDALYNAGLTAEEMDFLAAASTQGDLVAPGFASQVHGELGSSACEIASLQSFCASGVMAFKNAWLQVRCGEKNTAVACASEFASRLFKASRLEEQEIFKKSGRVSYDTEFLRWMLSDGAGAVVLRDTPNPRGLSLRVDWVQLSSHAGSNELCMYVGCNKDESGNMRDSWLDFPGFHGAADSGALNLKQDLRALQQMLMLGVSDFFKLVEEGYFAPKEVDHLVVHYSSHVFRDQIMLLLEKGGVCIPQEKWFSNLPTKGNTGSASIYLLLEELLNEGHLKAGQRILCMVPESGRFVTSFLHFTVVEGGSAAVPETVVEPKAPALNLTNTGDAAASLVRRLASVWVDFETKLGRVPLLETLARGQFTTTHYQMLLMNLRQQVIEGARWIARAASNLTIDAFALRSLFIQHAGAEHRDYQMLERDYVSVGGDLAAIRSGEKNIGSEALSAWMFHRASFENPFDLLGAMFIIEGLGSRMASRWGQAIMRQLNLDVGQVSFLLYHGDNDGSHFEKLEHALSALDLQPDVCDRIVKTAKVTARLYLLQLEELGEV